MNEELLLIEEIELWACMCDLHMGFTCGVHDMIEELKSVVEETDIAHVNRNFDLKEEVTYLTDTLETIKYNVAVALNWEN